MFKCWWESTSGEGEEGDTGKCENCDIVEMIVIKNRNKALTLCRGRTHSSFNRKEEYKHGSRSVGFVKKF